MTKENLVTLSRYGSLITEAQVQIDQVKSGRCSNDKQTLCWPTGPWNHVCGGQETPFPTTNMSLAVQRSWYTRANIVHTDRCFQHVISAWRCLSGQPDTLRKKCCLTHPDPRILPSLFLTTHPSKFSRAGISLHRKLKIVDCQGDWMWIETSYSWTDCLRVHCQHAKPPLHSGITWRETFGAAGR
jgi:hypothetical protein